MPSETSIRHWRIGTSHSEHARPSDAVKEFTIAIELSPLWALPYFWRAGEYEELRMLAQAESDWTQFIELCDTGNNILLAEAYAGRGYARKLLGILPGAIEDYTREIEINPQSAIGYLDRSLVHDALGNDDSATADYEAARKLDSSVVNLAKGRPGRRTSPKNAT